MKLDTTSPTIEIKAADRTLVVRSESQLSPIGSYAISCVYYTDRWFLKHTGGTETEDSKAIASTLILPMIWYESKKFCGARCLHPVPLHVLHSIFHVTERVRYQSLDADRDANDAFLKTGCHTEKDIQPQACKITTCKWHRHAHMGGWKERSSALADRIARVMPFCACSTSTGVQRADGGSG